jgi:hypothetical protein
MLEEVFLTLPMLKRKNRDRAVVIEGLNARFDLAPYLRMSEVKNLQIQWLASPTRRKVFLNDPVSKTTPAQRGKLH